MPGKEIEAPSDIRDLVQQAYNIPRYEGIYKEGIFDDNLGKHIERGIARIRKLDIDPEIKEQVTQIFWVHDLPETVLGDITVVEKLEKRIDLEAGQAEGEVAKVMLSPERLEQYIQFELASEALKGKPIGTNLQPAAFIARIIDIADGNEFFHLSLTTWFASENYDEEAIPSEIALTHTFNSYQQITDMLNGLSLDTKYISLARGILKKQIETVRNYWTNVPLNRIPVSVKDMLNSVEEFL